MRACFREFSRRDRLSVEQMAIAQLEQLKANYGLREDPFSPRLDAFYGGGQRDHAIEVLRHMAIFGDMVLALLGEAGAGKSHLISRFSLLYSGDIAVHTIAAGSSGSDSVSRFASLAGMDMPEGYPSQDLLELLVDQLTEHYKRTGKRTLLVIDDAHYLSSSELNVYLTVMASLEPECGAALLLSGSLELGADLKAYRHPDRDDWLHQITLKPLNAEEIRGYLLERFNAAGYEGDELISEAQLNVLVAESGGQPGGIHAVFCKKFLSVSVGDSEGQELNEVRTKTADQYALYGIAGALLLSFAFLAYQYDFFSVFEEDMLLSSVVPEKGAEEVPEPEPLEDNPNRDTRLAAINQAIKDSGAADQVGAPDSVSPFREDASLGESVESAGLRELEQKGSLASAEVGEVLGPDGGEEGEDASVASLDNDASNRSSSETATAKEASSPSGVSAPKSASTIDVASSELGVAETKVARSKENEGLIRSRQWLMGQPADGYTAQVLGSYSEKTAINFVEGLSGKTEHPVYYVESLYKGKKWFVALYGNFGNKAAAKRALQSAIPEITSQKPWLRSFGALQSSLSPSR